ncbi:MAG: threonine--tRNA ligase [Deltaproteobacteria bacterium]|nr:threonine--tRNA ligase [Deltaproteobacteria bacterium]
MVCREGKENDSNEILRHSAAHIMADAVQRLFKGVKVTIGPTIENGFYYDFDSPKPFSTEDLELIEKEMQKIADANLSFTKEEVSREEAIALFQKMGENYKVEIIEGLDLQEKISLFRHGEFVDLCRGPHISKTSELKAFKLLTSSGSYWRGDEKNARLQRIYGTAFTTKEDLEAYLEKLREAEARDHRKLGVALDLFSTLEERGPGLILWHPKGARIRGVIEDFWRATHRQRGYELVFTPHMAKLDVWRTSGHVDFYKDSMYSPMEVEGQDYEIKPMNCPFHIMIFQSRIHSYRNLPIRMAELGTVYRFERSGTLHGLMRVRGFTQDDAHIFCTPSQIEKEVSDVLDLVVYFMKTFGFKEYEVFLSTQPDKYVGTDENWKIATESLRSALEKKGFKYEVDPGEGVFYGPKIDVKVKDVLGRMWQCSTVQVDFNLPDRFKIEYVGEDGNRHQPIMIHRALMGSLERFFGILIEQYAGAFPLWLAPVQVNLIPIAADQVAYAEKVKERLLEKGYRVEVDARSEKLGLKIRESQMQKIPYMVVMGAKEVEAERLSVRSRVKGDLGQMDLEQFLLELSQQMELKQ